MSLFTLTITETYSLTAIETSTFLIPTSTVTTRIPTTIAATPGQTVTFFALDSPPFAAVPSSKYTPTIVPTVTLTVFELDVALQAPRNNVWTTLAFQQTPTTTATSMDTNSGQEIFVAPGLRNGWDSWTDAQKGGLIAGVILFALFLMALLWCVRQRRRMWITQDMASGREMERWQGRHGNPANYYPGPVLRGGGGGREKSCRFWGHKGRHGNVRMKAGDGLGKGKCQG